MSSAASSSSSSSSMQSFVTRDPLFKHALTFFESNFGIVNGSTVYVGVAPGRVNLIGEHTDYNDGFVFPLAIERRTYVIARPNGRNNWRLVSSNVSEAHSHSASDSMDSESTSELSKASAAKAAAMVSTVHGGKRRKGDDGLHSKPIDTIAEFDYNGLLTPTSATHEWHNYLRGVIAQYAKAGFFSEANLPKCDIAVCGDVPLGGGLSSSASLEVATASMLECLLGLTVDGVKRALACQAAEHEFAGVPCGIMDQFVSSLAVEGHALLIDCRSNQHLLYPLDDPSVSLLITNTNVKHQLSGGEYAERRRQCEAAVAALKTKYPSIQKLRDATLSQLMEEAKSMDETVMFRARHVITENDRTVRAAECLKNRDWKSLGQLMVQSHVSLKSDYEVSCNELDALVDIALSVPGVYGAGMTGGGFGGCTVTLVATEAIAALQSTIADKYPTRCGLQPTMIVTRPGQGAGFFTYFAPLASL